MNIFQWQSLWQLAVDWNYWSNWKISGFVKKFSPMHQNLDRVLCNCQLLFHNNSLLIKFTIRYMRTWKWKLSEGDLKRLDLRWETRIWILFSELVVELSKVGHHRKFVRAKKFFSDNFKIFCCNIQVNLWTWTLGPSLPHREVQECQVPVQQQQKQGHSSCKRIFFQTSERWKMESLGISTKQNEP